MQKRIISLFLTIIMVISLLPVSVLALILGDVSGDGAIHSDDARTVLRASVKLDTLTSEQSKAADVDFDGKITSSDARLILRASVGLETIGTPSHKESEEELLSKEAVYNPSPKPLSGTKAFSVNPAPGLTVSAPANALDKERTFKAQRLSAEKTDSYFDRTLDLGEIPLAAFDIDAGVKFPQKFPGDVTLSFDLAKIGIEPELRDKCHVVSINDNGEDKSADLLVTKYNNGILTCKTNHNSAFIITISIVCSVGTGTLFTLDYFRMGIPNIKFYGVDIDGNAKYRVYYPASMPGGETEESRKLKAEEQEIYNKYYKSINIDIPGADAATYGQAFFRSKETEQSKKTRLAKALVQDKRYQQIQAKYKDSAWIEKNLLPNDVKRTIKAIKYADEFLFGFANLKMPNHRVEIFMFDGPKGGNAFAHTVNLLTTKSFIKLYKNDSDFGNDTGLAVTIAHEMTHVCQGSRYCFWDDRHDTGFWEATAILSEKEAYNYFVNKGYIKNQSGVLTARNNWGDFKYPLMLYKYWTGEAEKQAEELSQNQGYTASYFLEFVRDRYKMGKNASTRMKFLRDLLDAYSSVITTDWMDALASITSGKESVLAEDFLLFCMRNTDKFIDGYQNMTITTVVDNPIKPDMYSYRLHPSEVPMYCDFYYYKISNKLEKCATIILFNDDDKDEEHINHIVRIIDAKTGKAIKFIRGSGRCLLPNEIREFYVQIIHASDTVDGQKAVLDIMTFMPQQSPNTMITYDGENNSKKDIVRIKTGNYNSPKVSKTICFDYNGKITEYHMEHGYGILKITKSKLMEMLGIEDIKELDKVKVSMKQRLIAKDKEGDFFGPDGEKGDLISKGVDYKKLEGTYKGTYNGHPATCTITLTQVRNGFQYATFTYDFGELKSNGKTTSGQVIEWFFVERKNSVELGDASDTFTFDPFYETVTFTRKNGITGKITTVSNLRKVK